MSNVIKIIIVIAVLSTITSCDRLYDIVISFADMKSEDILKEIPDDVLLQSCTNEAYINAIKITKKECSDSIISRKEICINNASIKWVDKISKKSEIEELTTDYVNCVMLINEKTETN